MIRIVSSPLALRVVVALAQAPDGRRVSDLAKSLDAPFTSVERALELLQADEVVARHDHRSVLLSSPRAEAVVRLAIAFLEPMDLLTVVSRSNRAVEFCGHDEQGVVIVVRRFADLADEAALAHTLELLGDVRDLHVEVLEKGALRERLAVDDSPRTRAQQMQVLAGSVDRSFPDRTRHGDPGAPPLGTLHPSLPTPSQRRLKALARRYHLRRMSAFGSATRADFRPDSDVDLLVEPVEGYRPRIGEMVRLGSEVEELFGRDVDLLTGPIAPASHDNIERDAVVLYDAGR